MESLRVERLDHFGLIVSVIKDIRLIESIASDNPSQAVSGRAPRRHGVGSA